MQGVNARPLRPARPVPCSSLLPCGQSSAKTETCYCGGRGCGRATVAEALSSLPGETHGEHPSVRESQGTSWPLLSREGGKRAGESCWLGLSDEVTTQTIRRICQARFWGDQHSFKAA